MITTIRDLSTKLEYEVGKIYSFDNLEDAEKCYISIKRDIGLDVNTFTNESKNKYYIQIKPLFISILNQDITISTPNIFSQEELDKIIEKAKNNIVQENFSKEDISE